MTPPQRGTRPGGGMCRPPVVHPSSPKLSPGGAVIRKRDGGEPYGFDPFVGMVNRHERFVDDITGQPLNPGLCRIARQKELDYFVSKGVWDMRSVQEARAKMGKPPISVRWVEVNKGDDENPNYRSRLVAREIRMVGEDALFAPTLPWNHCVWCCHMP